MVAKKGSEYKRKATPGEKKALEKKRNGDPPEVEEDSQPVYSDQFPEYTEILDEVGIEYRTIAVEMKRLEGRRQELSELAMTLCKELGYNKINGPGYQNVRIKQVRHPLSETKLVDLGVDLEIIEAAKGEVKTEYIQVLAIDSPSEVV